MRENVHARVRDRSQEARRLVLLHAQLRMEGRDDEIHLVEEVVVHVARPFGREIHLDAAEDAEAGRHRGVRLGHLAPLPAERPLILAARDGKALRVVGDADVLVAERRADGRHLPHRRRTVGPRRVDLQIAAIRVPPAGSLTQRRPCLGERQESRAQRRSRRRLDRRIEPLGHEVSDPGADELETCEGLVAFAHA
jgi:hypothetical protein